MKVSIIIPTFNRSDQLGRTLFYLTLIKTDPDLFEIIVIDNGSTDCTKQIVEKYQNEFKNIQISYFYDAEPGLLTGRHLGADKAKAEILTFIDDDVHVSPNWLNSIIEVMESNSEISFLTGPNLPLYENYPPNWLNFFWRKEKNGKSCSWLSLLDLGNEIQKISPNYVWGLNFTTRKLVFIELGGFHPDCIPSHLQMFQGDGETGLTMKGIEIGLKALYHPGVLLYHEVPSSRLTFEYFENRAFYDGVGSSFFKIREEDHLYNFNENKKPAYKISLYNKIKKHIKNKIFNKKKELEIIPEEIKIFKERLIQKKQEGFLFHQNEYNKSNELKKWVLKKNYFDYKLPKI